MCSNLHAISHYSQLLSAAKKGFLDMEIETHQKEFISLIKHTVARLYTTEVWHKIGIWVQCKNPIYCKCPLGKHINWCKSHKFDDKYMLCMSWSTSFGVLALRGFCRVYCSSWRAFSNKSFHHGEGRVWSIWIPGGKSIPGEKRIGAIKSLEESFFRYSFALKIKQDLPKSSWKAVMKLMKEKDWYREVTHYDSG